MSLLETAINFHSLGFNVTAITNYLSEHNFYTNDFTKRPYHNFENLFEERQNLNDLKKLDFENAIGIGTVSGFANLLVIDIDCCFNYSVVNEICEVLGLPLNYEWIIRSGSKTGYHIYLYVPYPTNEELDKYHLTGYNKPSLENKTQCWTYPGRLNTFEKLEFLWKTHVVLPPSLHKSTFLYEFVNCNFPENPPLLMNSFSESNLHKIINREWVSSDFSRTGSEIYINPCKWLESNSVNDNLKKEKSGTFYCFIDLETDGLVNNTNIPKITQLSWCLSQKYYDGDQYTSYGLLKKETHIVKNAFYDLETVEKYSDLNTTVFELLGKDLYSILNLLKQDLEMCENVIGFNVKFEREILTYYFQKYDMEVNVKQWTCVMEAFQRIYPDDKYIKLSDLHKKLFGFCPDFLHNAIVDALITLRCFKKLYYQTDNIIFDNTKLSIEDMTSLRLKLDDIDGAIILLEQQRFNFISTTLSYKIKLFKLYIKVKKFKRAISFIDEEMDHCFRYYAKGIVQIELERYNEAINNLLAFIDAYENEMSNYHWMVLGEKLSFCYYKVGNISSGVYYSELAYDSMMEGYHVPDEFSLFH